RVASLMYHALATLPGDGVLVPTHTGTTGRIVSRCKPQVWIIAPSREPAVCQGLAFSYAVYPVDLSGKANDNWRAFASKWLKQLGIRGKRVMLVAGPSTRN